MKNKLAGLILPTTDIKKLGTEGFHNMRSMQKKRKICVATGTRADYGLLSILMSEIVKDKSLELSVIASCMHLSPEFGMTYREIEADGFRIDEKIEMLLSSDTPSGITKSAALGLIGYADALQRIKPDILVILGDRFEALSAAEAALFAGIPIAHISGGEKTEGAFDEAIRHSITKMSHIHFTTADEYSQRVIQLGESPNRVFNTGSLNVDVIAKSGKMTRSALEKKFHFKLKKRNIVATFHPATLDNADPADQFKEMLSALDEFMDKDTFVIFTKPNADTGGRKLIKMLDEFVSGHPENSAAFTSMGREGYHSGMRQADIIIGNSSSGITEAPSFKIATVNIGNRQKGRIRAASVIDCAPEKKQILAALKKACSPEFKRVLETVKSPFGTPGAAKKMVEVLKKIDLSGIRQKTFLDI